MAMLAEPRNRRKRYNLCPRGKALYEDDTRFGTKMLEKMGWTKGKGLGPKENGDQEFVRVRFKNDAEGLGFEARDDQWTEHEEGFNGLLKALNGGESNHASNDENSDVEAPALGFGFKKAAPEQKADSKKLKEKISGVSLEEKSKQSRARVHYKKFTRGKDLAQYSEKDLANIFGKKATEDETLATPLAYYIAPQPEEEEKEVNEKEVNENFVSTGLSVSDYFKQKMDAMKSKLKNGGMAKVAEKQALLNGCEKNEEEAVKKTNGYEEPEPVKKKKRKHREEEEEQIEEPPKLKKQKKEKLESLEEVAMETEIVDEPKKKKKKDKREDKEQLVEEVAVEEVAEETATKKKKKSKKEEIVEAINTEDLETVSSKKKKKAQKEKADNEIEETSTKTEEDSVSSKKKKKSKKDKVDEARSEEVVEATNSDDLQKDIEIEETSTKTEEDSVSSKKKKKKSQKEDKEQLVEDLPMAIECSVEFITNKKKKKKQKQQLETEVSLESSPASTSTPANDEADCSGDKSENPLAAQLISLEDMIKKRDSYDIYKISSFCAEKFHMLKMSAFKNSSLAEIVGYAVNDNIKLEIVELPSDRQRIVEFWNGTVNKYKYIQTSKIKSTRFVKRSTLKAIKRRNAFSCL